MQKKENKIFYSATDLVNFMQCEHRTTMDMINLETPMERAEASEEMRLIQDRGFDHEHEYVKRLKNEAEHVAEITADDFNEAVVETIEALKKGAGVIYQATLRDGCFIGHADFLRRIDNPSRLGDYSYEVMDTKLSRTAKPAYIIQLCFYSELLSKIQGRDPESIYLVLGDMREEKFRCADYAKYYASIKREFIEKVDSNNRDTYPEPCELCDMCDWREICARRWEEDDHPCQVANITKIQTNRLSDAGAETLKELALLPEGTRIPKMASETLKKLRHQASLQLHKRETGEDICELLPLDPDGIRGFARLPKPDEGDIFFDMEGDPLEAGGLEYLFGVYYKDCDSYKYRAFWGHNRVQEKKAFEDFMDFLTKRLKKYPNAHIYHYAHYEETALKRLMCLHGTKEAEVDNLLRKKKLVDLFKVVREGIRVSEPGYSIKNIEKFYIKGEREGEVTTALGSVVYYERWRQEKNPGLLNQIEDYNENDCRSTYLLREWLLERRPGDIAWFNPADEEQEKPGEEDTLTDTERLLIPYREALSDTLPEERNDWTEENRMNELIYYLLDFHRRADKPGYWELFSREEMTDDEAIEDPECLGRLQIDREKPPFQDKRSYVYTYSFDDQDTKIKTGDGCVRVGVESRDPVNNLVVDENNRKVTFRYAANRPELPDIISIGPSGPLDTSSIRGALRRFADSIIKNDNSYPALKKLLKRESPVIKGLRRGSPIIDESKNILEQTIRQVEKLDDSYVFIQGPPGSGKTFTGGHVIVNLLQKGYRVGVTSNSHKAINNLLSKVEAVAVEKEFGFSGVKKSDRINEDSCLNGKLIRDVFGYDEIESGGHQLVAGTAWLFSREALDRRLDFLIVDEAGQVALGNLIAMGTSARNIVLLGDQMQLGQPIQGVHPGDSGMSCLDYLLYGKATIPLEMGIFLKTTWRMHPDVCRFISDAVYDGRLLPEPENEKQALILNKNAPPALKPCGVQYLPVEHDGCSQSSEEEAGAISEMYESLLKQQYRDKHGKKHKMSHRNILVVAPYNMQVNLLNRVLPDGARVGTVDKFQGQEAEAVIVSMTTTSEEYLPRHIEFLYSKNRLNVALSRARCFSILVANQLLMSIKCKTIDQMALVNTLCWVRDYSELSD
ncbi:MAG: TM0106 family RecB-like putative nuclease [bacterium]